MQKPAAISYAIFALLLVLVAALHLGMPFIVAMFCYLALSKLMFFGRKWIAVTLFVILIAALFSGFVFFLKRAVVVLPEVVETAIPVVVRYAEKHGFELPFTDLDSLRGVALDTVRGTLGDLGNSVKIATKEFVFLVVGVIVAIGVFLNPDFEPQRQRGKSPPNLYSFYTSRIKQRFASFYRSFETVIGAQIIISAINTALTAIFVLASGLRYGGVAVALTFVCGLIPIVGNILSNSVIIGIAFTMSPKLAAYAFLFLVIIHKLEYFLNSRIIGSRIHHPMWLMLLALLIGDRLIGLSGLILAPVIISFLKVELKKIPVATPAGDPPPLARESTREKELAAV